MSKRVNSSIYLYSELLEKIEEIGKKKEWSRSKVIENILMEYFKIKK